MHLNLPEMPLVRSGPRSGRVALARFPRAAGTLKEGLRPGTNFGNGLTSLTSDMSTSRRSSIKLLGRALRPNCDHYTSSTRCALPRYLRCDARTVFAQCLVLAPHRSRHRLSSLGFGHVVLCAGHQWYRRADGPVLDGTDPAPGDRAIQPRRQHVPGLPQRQGIIPPVRGSLLAEADSLTQDFGAKGDGVTDDTAAIK